MKGNLKIKGILIATALLLVMAFAGNASASQQAWVNDTSPSDVNPGQTYKAFNITFQENDTAGDDTAANLTWLNVTGFNSSLTDLSDINYITNVTVYNETNGWLLGYNKSFSGFNISVELNENLTAREVANNATYKIGVNLTLNTTGLVDGRDIALNASLATNESSNWVNDTVAETVDIGSFNNVSAAPYDSKAQIKVHVNSSASNDINSTSINLAVKNLNTSNTMWIVKNGEIVNGTAMADNDLDNSGNASAQVEVELQEGVYNWTTVSDVTDTNDNTIKPGMSGFSNFTVNMSGSKMKVIPDDPVLQLEGSADANEKATVNVTVVDKYGNEVVFNESDVGVAGENATLSAGDSSVSINKTYTSDYPCYLNQTSFNVTDTEAETVTLTAYDVGPTGLDSGSADQVFTPRIDDVTVTVADGQVLADGSDYELVTAQLVASDGTPVERNDISISWAKENATAAGLIVNSKDSTTNASGMAQFNMSATESGVTVTITAIEGYTGSSNSGSATVNTVAGAPNNTNSKLLVNGSTGDETDVTVGDSLPVAVLVNDSQNNPVEGVEVTLSANTSGTTFDDSTPTTNANGWANTTVTLPTEVNTTMVRAITGSGNDTKTPPELNKTVNVTTKAAAVAQVSVSPSKNIGIPNVPGESKDITVQLQDQYGNDNNSANADILVTTDNEALGNMTNDTTTVNNNMWFNITSGSDSFTYNVNSTEVATATLTLNVTTYGFTDTVNISTSGPTGLKVLVNNTLPLVGDTVMTTAQLQGDAGDIAISGKSLTFTLRNPSGNLVDTYTDTTDDDGKVTWNFTQTTLGEYTIKARNTSLDISDTNTTTYVGNATQITIDVNNTSPQVNDTITVNAIFKDSNGYNSSSVDGDYVEFLADGGQFANNSISNAVASATYTPTSSGELDLDVFYTNETNPYWDGDVQAASTTVNVSEPTGEANIQYSNLNVSPESGDKPLDVTANATVENTGDAAGDYNASFKVDGAVVDFTTGSLNASENTTVSFDHTFDTAGKYNVTIDDLTAVEVNVTTAPTANMVYSDLSVSPTSGNASLDVTASATVENTGGAAGDYNASFKVDGAVMDYATGTLDAGNSTTVSFDHTFDTADTYNVTIEDLTAVEVSVEVGVESPPVKINEFLPGPMSLNYIYDYIELYNPTDSAVDLTGWTIASPPSDVDIYSLDGKSIPAGGYLVLNESELDFSLAYDGDIIELKNGTSLVDDVTYGNYDDGNITDNAPAPGEDNSTARDPNGADTDNDADDFRVFTNVTLGESNTPGVEEGPTYAGDLDGDGLFEDVDDSGALNFGDVVALFNNFDSSQFVEDKQYFDFDGDGNLTFGDVVELFNML